MSINQNNTKLFTKLAFEQAKINLGSTGLNPSVGCVVVKNNSIISSGHTSLKGRPHAEHNALKRKINFKDSKIYITLEPCFHYGKTPPCSRIITKKKIRSVNFSLFDADKRTKYKTIKYFKQKKIKIKHGLLKKIGEDFYKSYILFHKKKIPLIDAKIAISKDYFTKNKKKKWITNEHSRIRANFLRSNYGLLISTSKSVNEDGSLLDCRIEGLEKKSPDVLIIDRNFKLKINSNLFCKKERRIILLICKTNKKKEKHLKERGVRILKFKKMTSYNDFSSLFCQLNLMGYSRVFIETGLTFLNFLISNKFVNNLYVFKSSKKLNNNGFNFTKSNLIKRFKLKNKVKVNLFDDMLYKIKIK